MRDAIVALGAGLMICGGAPACKSKVTGKTVTPAKECKQPCAGTAAPRMVESVVSALPEFQPCMTSAVQKHLATEDVVEEDTLGSPELVLRIDESGHVCSRNVRGVAAETLADALERCVDASLAKRRFPPPTGGCVELTLGVGLKKREGRVAQGCDGPCGTTPSVELLNKLLAVEWDHSRCSAALAPRWDLSATSEIGRAHRAGGLPVQIRVAGDGSLCDIAAKAEPPGVAEALERCVRPAYEAVTLPKSARGCTDAEITLRIYEEGAPRR